MPQPPGYDRNYDLTEYATANPSAPYNAAQHDAEFDDIEATLDQVLINLTYIQRDDGPLKNGVVTTDSLSSAVAALLATGEGELRGAWLTATAYAVRDVVTNSGSTYICVTAHTSGVFATDLAAGKWIAIDTGNSITAAGVSFSPTGSVAATTVQTAIAEVDSEKLAKASNLSDLASRATSFTNLVAGGGTMTGALTFSGARLNEAKGADVASASTIDLDAATGNIVDVTGTTAITAITLSEGREAVVRFTGVLTLTNGASLVLPGAANITTAAGDFAVFRGYAAGVVRCVVYSRLDGTALNGSSTSPTITTPTLNGAVSGTSIASQSDMETGTATDKLATPGRMQYHQGMAKAWCVFDGTGANGTKTPTASYNLDGTTPVTKNGTGDYTINFGTDFSTANYAIAISSNNSTAVTFGCIDTTTATAAGLVRIAIRDAAGAATNSDRISVIAFGDQ